MPPPTDWKETTRQILDALDIRQTYESLGVQFTRREPSPKGWLECWAINREHGDHPTAAVHVGTGKDRGYYKDMGGEGERLSLWDFAARYGSFPSWQEARKHFAQQTNTPFLREPAPQGESTPQKPEDLLRFHDKWLPFSAQLWAQFKPGVNPEILQDTGARMACFRRMEVLAFPIYNTTSSILNLDTPCGWVVVNMDGRGIPYKAKGATRTEILKTQTVYRSRSGLMNKAGLAALSQADIIWKVEGLSDLLTLYSKISPDLRSRHAAITNSAGANQWPENAWKPLFAGKTVYVVGDCDDPGQSGAAKWLQTLQDTAADIRNVVLPYDIAPNHGHDLRDYFLEGHSYEDLLHLGRQTPSVVYQPETPSLNGHTTVHLSNGQKVEAKSGEQELLASIKLFVLGEYDDGSVEVFSEHRKKLSIVRSVKHLAYSELLQIGGEIVKKEIYDGKPAGESVDARKRSMTEVRNAIGLEAGKVRLTSRAKLGAGIWRVESSPSDIIIIDNGEAATLNSEGVLKPVTLPRLGDQVLDFATSSSWCNFALLAGNLKALKGDLAKNTLADLIDLFGQWNWKYKADAKVAAGLAIATWVQTMWDHRPLVFVLGQSYAGKSIMFDEFLDPFFGKLLFHSGVDITEPGLRQFVGHTAVAIIMDEFENSPHRPKVMTLLRTSTRGGHVYRGTGGSQKGVSFSLRHIPWMAATETGLRKEQDRNRFIIMEMMPLADASRRIHIPPRDAIRTCGEMCLALALNYFHAANAIYHFLRETPLPGVQGRIIDCYSIPASILAAIQEFTLDQARSLLKDMISDRFADISSTSEHEDLLRDILESLIPMGSGRSYSVNEIISNPEIYREASDTMERHGIAVAHNRRGPRGDSSGVGLNSHAGDSSIFVNVSSCQQNLLWKNHRWLSYDIESLLLRLPGARRAQHTIANGRGRGIEIPASGILAISASISARMPQPIEDEAKLEE